VPSPTVFPVQGKASFSNDWGGSRSRAATGGTGRHQGTDIFAPMGTPVVAVASGIITKLGPSRIGGNRVWINGQFYYAHLKGFAKGLKVGARVSAGQVIGYVGNTGDAKGTPPHLHFGYDPRGTSGGAWKNPYALLASLKAGGAVPSGTAPAAAPAAAAGDVPAALPEFGRMIPLRPPGPGDTLPGAAPPGTADPGAFTPKSVSDYWKVIAGQPGAGDEAKGWLGMTDET
jgi:murein DD-endopeptidase MepM/ murein hydrolase activator NlpD